MLSLFLAISLTRPPDLTKPPKGNTRVVVKGAGSTHATANDFVKVNYVLWHYDGKLVDDFSNTWIVVDVEQMSPEWKRDTMAMVEGEERMTWIPELETVIDTKLLRVIPKPEAPPDVAAPPADATVTPSGLAYKILRQGPGTVHPKPNDTVIVQYSAWTANGALFDTTAVRDEVVTVPVSGGTIPGWTEALQLMTSGTKARFWIPEKLAYTGVPNKPQGMVVFDIELGVTSSEIMPKRGQRRPARRPPIP